MTADPVKKTSVYLPEPLRAKIQATARSRGVSQAQLIRAWLSEATGESGEEPNPGVIVASGVEEPDW